MVSRSTKEIRRIVKFLKSSGAQFTKDNWIYTRPEDFTSNYINAILQYVLGKGRQKLSIEKAYNEITELLEDEEDKIDDRDTRFQAGWKGGYNQSGGSKVYKQVFIDGIESESVFYWELVYTIFREFWKHTPDYYKNVEFSPRNYIENEGFAENYVEETLDWWAWIRYKKPKSLDIWVKKNYLETFKDGKRLPPTKTITI